MRRSYEPPAILWFNKLIAPFEIAAAMKANAVTRASGSIAALLVLALQPEGVLASTNDGATARQKTAIEAFAAAHKEYLKTGDMATFTSKLDRSARVGCRSE